MPSALGACTFTDAQSRFPRAPLGWDSICQTPRGLTLILKSWLPRKEQDPHTRVCGVQIHRDPSGPCSPPPQHLLWVQQQGWDLTDLAQWTLPGPCPSLCQGQDKIIKHRGQHSPKCALQAGFILPESSQTSRDAFFTSGAVLLLTLAHFSALGHQSEVLVSADLMRPKGACDPHPASARHSIPSLRWEK